MTPTSSWANLMAEQQHAKILKEAREWVKNHVEVVEAVAQAGRLNWNSYENHDRQRMRREADVWLTAMRMAGVPLTGEIWDWRNPAPEVDRQGRTVPVATVQYVHGLVSTGLACAFPETVAAVAAARMDLDDPPSRDDPNPDKQEALVKIAKQWLTAAAFVGLTIHTAS